MSAEDGSGGPGGGAIAESLDASIAACRVLEESLTTFRRQSDGVWASSVGASAFEGRHATDITGRFTDATTAVARLRGRVEDHRLDLEQRRHDLGEGG